MSHLLWAMFCIGGCTYLVGWQGWSPWWYVLAVLLVVDSLGDFHGR